MNHNFGLSPAPTMNGPALLLIAGGYLLLRAASCSQYLVGNLPNLKLESGNADMYQVLSLQWYNL